MVVIVSTPYSRVTDRQTDGRTRRLWLSRALHGRRVQRDGGGHVPIIGVGGRQRDCPPKFMVFVITLNSEEYSSTPT